MTEHVPDLTAIAARIAAATPGPWELDPVTVDEEAPEYDLYPPDCAPIARLMVRCPLPDAIFIAHARTDLPALVAEVCRLRALLTCYADVIGEEAIHAATERQ